MGQGLGQTAEVLATGNLDGTELRRVRRELLDVQQRVAALPQAAKPSEPGPPSRRRGRGETSTRRRTARRSPRRRRRRRVGPHARPRRYGHVRSRKARVYARIIGRISQVRPRRPPHVAQPRMTPAKSSVQRHGKSPAAAGPLQAPRHVKAVPLDDRPGIGRTPGDGHAGLAGGPGKDAVAGRRPGATPG